MCLPSLHGPERVYWVTDTYGPPSARKQRARLVSPLSFNWREVEGVWHYEDAHSVPMTYPEPAPNYTPEETARMAAAEVKRARKVGIIP